jgi:type II secretory pathway component PulC
MSEVEAQRRFRWIAMGFAAVAMVFAIVAVVVVLRRGDGIATEEKPRKTAVAPVSDIEVRATDVVKIERSNVEVVIESGETKGLRIKDAELEKLLGLEAGDVLTALSGRPLVRDLDFHDAVFNTSMMNATTLYLEVNRGGTPTLVRWKLDGDLRQARYGVNGSLLNSYGSYTPTPPAPDPLLDTIERVDNTHVTIPQKTIDQLLADPMTTAKGARVVPAMKNGKPDGLKLYAIRPSSVFARLNFANGDTVHAVNGHELTSADKALEVYQSLKDVSDVTIDVTRRGVPLRLFVTITK